MELGLSLGGDVFMDKAREIPNNKSLGFCMSLSISPNPREDQEDDDAKNNKNLSLNPPLQLDLLPHIPVPRRHGFRWPPSENGSSEADCSGNLARGLEANRLPLAAEEAAAAVAAESSSPNSAASSFQMDFCIYRGGNGDGNRRDSERASDEDENGNPRKKLRLSKDQSDFLEESFKEHNTLNPKQKQALAKQLNLRPRQVEVWFQNRRARTKLKQTEVDCEYLKRCCETLTEENRRLHKELQELRTLKSSNPFYMQLPATTLTMCPSCERVTTAATTTSTSGGGGGGGTDTTTSKATGFTITTPRFYPFSQTQKKGDQR